MNVWILLVQETGLSLNELYLLWCIHNKTKPLNINAHCELRKLKNKDLIDSESKITPMALEFISKLPGNEKAKVVTTDDITDDHIEKYVMLFPKGKLPSGKLARADRRNLKANFIWFFKHYKYDWEIILKATGFYVDEYERKNYLYMRTSQYFISKMNPDRSRESELANYCAQIISGDYQDDSNHFSEKVV
jgi:hypothetical protein